MNRLAVLAAVGVVLLLALPVLVPGLGAWGGTDGRATAAVLDQQPDYEAWVGAVWTPPSGEIESALFSLQAAVGGAVLGYVYRGWTED